MANTEVTSATESASSGSSDLSEKDLLGDNRDATSTGQGLQHVRDLPLTFFPATLINTLATYYELTRSSKQSVYIHSLIYIISYLVVPTFSTVTPIAGLE